MLGATGANLCPVGALLDYLARHRGAQAHCSGYKRVAHSIGLLSFNMSKQPFQSPGWWVPVSMATVFGSGQPHQQAPLACQSLQLKFLDVGTAWLTNSISALLSKTWQKYRLVSADCHRSLCVWVNLLGCLCRPLLL